MYLDTNEQLLKKMSFFELWKLKTSVISWAMFYHSNGKTSEYKKMESKLIIIKKYLPDKLKNYEKETLILDN